MPITLLEVCTDLIFIQARTLADLQLKDTIGGALVL
jgi:hypothetical protein